MHVYGQSAVYFEKYQLLADSLSGVYKIPSSVILAVAYWESGGGIKIKKNKTYVTKFL